MKPRRIDAAAILCEESLPRALAEEEGFEPPNESPR